MISDCIEALRVRVWWESIRYYCADHDNLLSHSAAVETPNAYLSAYDANALISVAQPQKNKNPFFFIIRCTDPHSPTERDGAHSIFGL